MRLVLLLLAVVDAPDPPPTGVYKLKLRDCKHVAMCMEHKSCFVRLANAPLW